MYKTLYKDYSGKPLIYLISPSTINIKTFPDILSRVLETQAVNVFQLRLKNYRDSDLISITSLLYKICIKKMLLLLKQMQKKRLRICDLTSDGSSELRGWVGFDCLGRRPRPTPLKMETKI